MLIMFYLCKQKCQRSLSLAEKGQLLVLPVLLYVLLKMALKGQAEAGEQKDLFCFFVSDSIRKF